MVNYGGGPATITVSPSGDTTGATDAARITAAVAKLPSTGGVVALEPAAPWYVACGQVSINRSGVYLDAPGVYINAVGTGDVIRMFDNAGTFWPVYGGGITGFPVIDGTSAGAGSCGIHMGDLLSARCDAYVQNFSGSGSIGIHFDNANYWTEQLGGRVRVKNCKQGVVFDVTGAVTSASSFARANLDIYIDQITASNDGLVVQNGALIYDGTIGYRGNFVGSASALTSCAVRVTGTVPAGHPGAGNFAGIYDCQLLFGLECAAAANTPTTFLFGNNSNLIKNCTGILDFGTDGAAANFTSTARIGNFFPFNGNTAGDTALTFGVQGFQPGAVWNVAPGLATGDFSTATVPTTGSTITTNKYLKRVNPGGNVTGIILGAGSFDGQLCIVLNESAFTLTMAASGTSHVADGTSDVIAAKTAAQYCFEGNDTNLWYRCV